MKRIIVVLHNIRSAYNVGAILRTAGGFGVERVIFSGYTPNGLRGLPHEREKMRRKIAKTALGGEEMVAREWVGDILAKIDELKAAGWKILALEQGEGAVMIGDFQDNGGKTVLILGEEVNGVRRELICKTDCVVEIPMRGEKESFNVSVAAGIALYVLAG
jgi:tRNA G18 (ribose-2'-O)-methylase SpoU